ncbi:flagellar type III secretion system protein FlhB [Leptospira interrogans]|uniref:EscU/YscU/HrcU family type III secretion system export apparatus switch protein n=1 Tax=Leptospira interrogans TaxID=173 RepID=UPI0002783C85|nr:EscU/YscU/HrcU family type III secretion system export apparatus switch protein [Leptospira interrogans]AKH76876.1 endoflagellar biosynthesis protein [Leptospira interrogans serovar Bratislava]EJP03190.1 flagellar biosynthesis protein FlhB [Leptospira interrogans serovar Bulgarica str. Mallika]EMN08612.1 flagellar biosynthesis protein FlhB [Leptospira interrogans serovar Muenchen str. Brem 129]KLO77409.1 Flagellar protein [Leptospira interrogans serovar Muenchen]UID82235.1 flagellar type II
MKKAIWSRTKKLVVVFVQNPKRFFIRIFYKNLSRVPWVCESGKNSFVKSVLDVFYRFMLFGKRFGKFIFWKQYYDIVSDFSKKCESSHNLHEIKNLMGVPTIYTRSKILWEFPQFTRDRKSCKSSYNLQNVVKSESDSDHFSNRNTVSLQNKQEGLVIKDVVHPTSFIFSFLHHFDRWGQKSTSHSLWMFRTIERFFSIIKKLFFKKKFSKSFIVGIFLFYKKIVKKFLGYSEPIDSKLTEFLNSNLFRYFLQFGFINLTIEIVRRIFRFKIFPPNICLSTEAADFKIDLQLFAAEDEGRTEPGSERRRREEREKGNVPKSPELPAAVVLLAGVILVYLMGEYFFMRTYYILRKYIHGVGLRTDMSSESVTELLKNASTDLFTLLWPLLGITLVGAIIGNVAQVGFIFTPRALSFNFSRIRPNFKKVLPTRQTLFNLGKSLAKVGLIAWVSYIIISKDFFPILLSGEMGLEQAVALVMNSSFKIFLIVGIILLAISIVDYLYQRYEYEESLKMTPSEAKREAKESDGDRSLQARRRQLARDMMNKRKMLAKVPEADVVITNPTHFAVALEYKPGIHKAPIVIAKGVDDFALLIIRIARENGVPTVEDRLQARGLYEEVELGAEVPQQFYRAIATILSRLESFRRAV